VEKYLYYFTFLESSEIQGLMRQHKVLLFDNYVVVAPLKYIQLDASKHLPQRKLAYEVTALVHGQSVAERATVMSSLLFDEDFSHLKTMEIVQAFEKDPRFSELKKEDCLGEDVVDVAALSGATKSKSKVHVLQKYFSDLSNYREKALQESLETPKAFI
jgi:tyrosyl-tRNA synthetase